jgi:hypothetical protein
VQLVLVTGVSDAADLRTANDRQQVEFVKGAGGFRESSKAQTLAQKPLWQIHLEDGRQAKGHTPKRTANGHGDGYCAYGGRIRQLGERAATLALTIK